MSLPENGPKSRPLAGKIVLEEHPLADLKPAPYNPRKIDAVNLAALEKSLERFGIVEPIIWNRTTGYVVGGHQRLAVLKAHKVESTSVVVVEITPTEEKALNVALNSPLLAGVFTEDVDALLDELAAEEPRIFEDLLLGGLFQTEAEQDEAGEWTGMPTYHSEDLTAFRTIHVHFADEAAVEAFGKLLGRELTKFRSIWFPEAEIGRFADKRYATKRA